MAIFARPTKSDIRWDEIESLLRALGATVTQRRGSRVGIDLNGVRAHAHTPHPHRVARKAVVDSMRRFLSEAGVEPP